MATNHYQQSVLIEIINKNQPDNIIDSFTLTLPPRSIEVIQSQRINRTPTYGGLFITDYGLGTAKITISGITGNNEPRLSYLSHKKTTTPFTGKEAIDYLRDHIIRYKTSQPLNMLESIEMRLYNLTTTSSAFTGSDIVDSWIVSLDDVTITQSAEKPIYFSFKIDFVGISPLGIYRTRTPAEEMLPIPNSFAPIDELDSVTAIITEIEKPPVTKDRTKNWLQDAVKAVTRTLKVIREAFTWTQTTVNKINNAITSVEAMGKQIEEYVLSAGNIITTGIGTYRKVFNIPRFPFNIVQAALMAVNTIMNEMKDAIEETLFIKETLGDELYNIHLLCNETKRIMAQIASYGKNPEADADTVININGKNITIYGIKVVHISAGNTIAQLAKKEYDDPEKGALLTAYNNITDTDIIPGMVIRVPLVTPLVRNTDNAIYQQERVSAFGTDMVINNSGEIIISENGDFSTVSDRDNLIQALNLRLNEAVGKRVRLNTYGLRTTIGIENGNAPITYILTNIKDTVIQDPRIMEITNTQIKGAGDTLYIAFTAKTVDVMIGYQGVV